LSLLSAHLNDAGLCVLDAETILYREPGFALLEDDGLTTGTAAFASARIRPRRVQSGFWANLQTEALTDRQFQHLSNADLVSRQLEQMWKAVAHKGDRLVVAVPAYMNNNNLALFLGIAAELDVPVVAMVDAAVAATRREYKDAVPVHIDLSQHSALLTRMSQAGLAAVDRSEVIEDSGLLSLFDEWRKVIAEAFVQQSRFDPLHTAETEQMLQDRIADWLTVASTSPSVALEIEFRGVTHQAEIESLALVAAAAPIYQRIASNLRALFRADETPAIQLSVRAALLPGLGDMLLARVGGEVFSLEAGATARGLITRCRDMQKSDSGVSLIKQLPWDQSAVQVALTETVSRGGSPTHILFKNTAYPIDSEALQLGSQPDQGRWIDLNENMPGVSRRHCALQEENGQCVIRDFSRYGSFLNGHAIEGSAVLQVGDSIRLGTPGFEFQLITTVSESGS
jgi:hypothetical protein